MKNSKLITQIAELSMAIFCFITSLILFFPQSFGIGLRFGFISQIALILMGIGMLIIGIIIILFLFGYKKEGEHNDNEKKD